MSRTGVCLPLQDMSGLGRVDTSERWGAAMMGHTCGHSSCRNKNVASTIVNINVQLKGMSSYIRDNLDKLLKKRNLARDHDVAM